MSKEDKILFNGFIIGTPPTGHEFVAEPLIITKEDLDDYKEGIVIPDSEAMHDIIEDCIGELEQKFYMVVVLDEKQKEKMKKALASEA